MCSLCIAIAKKREGEQKDLGDVLLNKIHLQCPATSVQLFPPKFYWLHQIDNSVGRESSLEPLLRPPISI
jgi:hypothetical protein